MTIQIGSLIKTQIGSNLQTLVTAGTLGAYIQEDATVNVLDLDFPGFPCAVLGMPSISSNYEYQQTNLRVYKFDVLIVQLADNITSTTWIEDLMDTILTQFDNNVTLNGYAPAGVLATNTPAIPVSSKGKNYIIFNVTIEARALANLTYSF